MQVTKRVAIVQQEVSATAVGGKDGDVSIIQVGCRFSVISSAEEEKQNLGQVLCRSEGLQDHPTFWLPLSHLEVIKAEDQI